MKKLSWNHGRWIRFRNFFKSDFYFSRYCIINILEYHILFNFNQIVIVFAVVNGKTFTEHEVEKIFQIGQSVQKLWPYFNLYVNVTQ